MEPRLKSSKKWTELPKEYLEQIQQVFRQNFKKHIGEGQIIAEGRIYPEELLLRVGFLEKGRLKQANFEASLQYKKNKDNVVQLIYFCIDCTASMMTEYFEAKGEADFPREWKKFEVDKQEIHLKHSTVNSALEAEADQILGEATEDLVQGDDEEDTRQAVISMLGLDDDTKESQE